MNIAYLILAHNNPIHFKALLHALDSESAFFFVHVDKKANIKDFYSTEKNSISFCEKRIDGAWGDFSLVQATLNLISMTTFHKNQFDYLVLLSGACYPIQPVSYIENFFAKHHGNEFIDAFPMPNEKYAKSMTRLRHYWIRKSSPFFSYRWKLQDFILKYFPERNYKKYLNEAVPYAGSQWWAITSNAAQYILAFIEENPSFYKFFKHTDCPDESFFQTILANSSYRQAISHNITYTDWLPNKTGPELIGEKQLKDLTQMIVRNAPNNNSPNLKQEVLFARKFDDIHRNVVDEINQNIEKKLAYHLRLN